MEHDGLMSKNRKIKITKINNLEYVISGFKSEMKIDYYRDFNSIQAVLPLSRTLQNNFATRN